MRRSESVTMRWPRWTIGRMILLVAGAAVLCVPLALWQRSVHFRELSRMYGQEWGKIPFNEFEIYLMTTARSLCKGCPPSERQRQAEEQKVFYSRADPIQQFVAHYRALQAKYAEAAAHPWRSVEPDPSLPPEPSRADIRAFRAWLDWAASSQNDQRAYRIYIDWLESTRAVMTAADGSLPSPSEAE